MDAQIAGNAHVIDGKAFAAALRERIAGAVPAFAAAAGRVPGLAVVLVGDDPASAVYVRHKTKDCVEVGMRGEQITLPASSRSAIAESITSITDPSLRTN